MFNRYSHTRYHMRKDEQRLVSIDAPLGDSDDDDSFTRGALLVSDEQLEVGLLERGGGAQLSERTRRALGALRAIERMALVAKDLRGLETTDAPRALGLSLPMLRFHLTRARQAFKTIYEALEPA
jgi:DNA-directed RNA polymerase specialized sigma24 family protein